MKSTLLFARPPVLPGKPTAVPEVSTQRAPLRGNRNTETRRHRDTEKIDYFVIKSDFSREASNLNPHFSPCLRASVLRETVGKRIL